LFAEYLTGIGQHSEAVVGKTTVSSAAEKLPNATFLTNNSDVGAATSTNAPVSSSAKNQSETTNHTAAMFEAANRTTTANMTTRNNTRTTAARSTTTEFPKYEDLPLDVISVDYPALAANNTVPSANDTVPAAEIVMLFLPQK